MQCPGSRGGAQEAGRAAPRNSGCGQAAGARDAKPAATAEQPSGRPTFAPPCVLRGSAAGRRPNPCSRVASARLAGHKVRSTAVRGPRPRRRRRHRHRSCQREWAGGLRTVTGPSRGGGGGREGRADPGALHPAGSAGPRRVQPPSVIGAHSWGGAGCPEVAALSPPAALESGCAA